MPKNIVVLLDGTGQEGGRGQHLNTNVYKMFTLLESRSPRQIVYYDRGVGSRSSRVTGNITGAGISKQILNAYEFINEHYDDNRDRLFLVGFSRGATAVRSLANFWYVFPFLPRLRPDLLARAWKIYRTQKPWRWRARRQIARYRVYGSGSDQWWQTAARWLGRQWTDEWDLRDPFDVVTALLPARTRFEYRQRFGHTWEDRLAEVKTEMKGMSVDEIVDATVNNVFLPRFEWGKNAAEDTIWHDIDNACWLMRVWTRTFDQSKDDPALWLKDFKRHAETTRFLSGATGFSGAGAQMPLHFVGCFDTVASLGLPFPRLNGLIDRIPGLHHSFHDLRLPNVKHAFHALALDERRRAFWPELWDDPYARQVWFTGVHTDIGGGYLERGLSDITLSWMLRMGHAAGLLLDTNPNKVSVVEEPKGVLHDSSNTWLKRFLFGKRRRTSVDLGNMTLHSTVFERMNADGPIWEWRRGRPEEVTADSYRKRVRDSVGRLDAAQDHMDEPEPIPFDLNKLIEEQERKWAAWADSGYPLWP